MSQKFNAQLRLPHKGFFKDKMAHSAVFATPTPNIVVTNFGPLLELDQMLAELKRGQIGTTDARERFLAKITLAQVRQRAVPRGLYRIFAARHVGHGYVLEGADLTVETPALSAVWGDVPYIAMIALTIGDGLEKAVESGSDIENIVSKVILDIAASMATENLADMVSADLARLAAANGLQTSLRYSPGYGDLPLTIQPDFERLLNMREELGIEVREGEMLHPYKSVTAFVALRPEPFSIPSDRQCDSCNLKKTCDRRVCRHGRKE